MRAYLDNTASTPLLPEVIEVMTDCMKNYYANPSSVHFHGRQAKVIIENARKTIATCLNATPSEIVFTSGGTEANNTAIYGCINGLGVKHAITSAIEHHAVLHTLEHFEQNNKIQIHYVNIDKQGHIDLNHLEELLKTYSNSLVTLMHANNEISNLLPIKEVSALCRNYDAFFHSDMVQSICHYNIDMQRIDVDFASSSGHKFHAPKGVGFLYINSKKVKINPLIFGGGQERAMRGGTENIHGIAGLAKAFELAHQSMKADMEYISGLKQNMVEKLKQNFQEIEFLGDSENKGLYTVLSVMFPENLYDDTILMNLDINGISASSGSACTSGALKLSHVLSAIQIPENRQTVRFSFSKLTNKEEIDFCLDVLNKIKK